MANAFMVVGILNTGKNYIYKLRSSDGNVTARFKFPFKKWKFREEVNLSDEELENAYQLEMENLK